MTRLHVFPLSIVLAAVAAIGLPVLPLPTGGAGAEPVAPEVREVPFSGSVQADGYHAESYALGNERFSMIAVSWELDSASVVSVQVRTHTQGQWSGWTAMDMADAFPKTEARRMRGSVVRRHPCGWAPRTGMRSAPAAGTQRPRDLRIDLIDPGVSRIDSSLGQAASPVPSSASAAVSDGRPAIIGRAEWGADESLRLGECPEGPKYTDPLKVGFVHHTASGNDYSADTAAAAIRGIYAYSVNTRGYCDVPYNFIVDKYGRIFEGRYGGIDAAVLSAATGGFNVNTFAVAALGTYSTVAPSQSMVDSIGTMVGWKLGRYGRDPQGTAQLTAAGGSGTTSKYADGTTVSVPAVSGHRQVGATECPGTTLFPYLDQIRAKAAEVAVRTPIKPPPQPTENFVRALYEDLLGRGASDADAESWASLVFRGLLTREQAARGFTASREWTRLMVSRLYEDRLGRLPDPSGWDAWSAQLATNPAILAEVDAGLIASDEFYAKAGGSPDAWVDGAYRELLGRQPDPAGLAGWVAVVKSVGRYRAAVDLSQAQESLQRRVTTVYRVMLARDPDPVGIQGWAPVVAARGDVALYAAVAASDEYFERAQVRFP